MVSTGQLLWQLNKAIATSHPSGLPTVLSDVRYWMNSRRYLLAKSISEFDPFRKSRSLDRKAALMHPLCSINTRMAAMNSGVVRLSMIAAMVMLATFGTTNAEEAAKPSITVPVLSNIRPDAAAY